MSVTGEVVRAVGFSVHVRRSGLAWRIRRAVTLVLLMGALGSAIGYSVVGRGRPPQETVEADELG